MTIQRVGDSEQFNYTGDIQTYTIPKTGVYKLEVWGGAGGYGRYNPGGNGGYSMGFKKLKTNQVIYIACGGVGEEGYVDMGGRPGTTKNGGWNGGGTGRGYYDTENWYYGNLYGGSGGGATHIAFVTGTLESIGKTTFDEQGLIVAGGGGGGVTRSNEQNYNGGDGNDSSASGSFGKGTNGGGNPGTGAGYWGQGGGGGGYLGGTLSNARGLGGSGWINGVEAYKETEPTMTSGVNSGSGYAKLTLVKASAIFTGEINRTIITGETERTIAIGDKEL